MVTFKNLCYRTTCAFINLKQNKTKNKKNCIKRLKNDDVDKHMLGWNLRGSNTKIIRIIFIIMFFKVTVYLFTLTFSHHLYVTSWLKSAVGGGGCVCVCWCCCVCCWRPARVCVWDSVVDWMGLCNLVSHSENEVWHSLSSKIRPVT